MCDLRSSLDGVWFLSMNLLFLATEQDEITRMSAYKSKGPISYDLVWQNLEKDVVIVPLIH
jgi:hypothetical protein